MEYKEKFRDDSIKINKKRLYAEQVKILYSNSEFSMLASIINSIILTVILWNQFNKNHLLIWFSAVLLISLGRYYLIYKYKKSMASRYYKADKWCKLMFTGIFLIGIVWGTAGVVFFPVNSLPHQTFMTLILGGMIAGSVPVYSIFYPVFTIFALTVILPIAVRFFLFNELIQSATGTVILVFGAVMLAAAKKMNSTTIFSMQLKFENRDLIYSLLSEKERVEKLNHELESKRKKLLEMTRRDGLTQLFNHNYIYECLDIEIAKSKRYKKELSIIMFDIDHFKQINDTYGHQKGDEVLKRIAEQLIRDTRRVDYLGRYGGEEFLIVLPETGIENAVRVAERIRVNIENIIWNDIDKRITISGGVKEYSGESITEFVAAADILLYAAKQKGRNQIKRNRR